jgi:hypothetical protein
MTIEKPKGIGISARVAALLIALVAALAAAVAYGLISDPESYQPSSIPGWGPKQK